MYRPGSPFRERASALGPKLVITGKPPVRMSPRPAPAVIVKPEPGVGTEIKNLFLILKVNVCTECGDKAAEWDRRGLGWCKQNKPTLITWLVGQAKRKQINLMSVAKELAIHKPLLATKIAAATVMHPLTDVAEVAASAIVHFAIESIEARRAVPRHIPAVVSVCNRDPKLHEATFRSLLDAGCDPIFATLEPDVGSVPEYVDARKAESRLGQWRNFVEALRIGLETNAPYFATIEDDVEVCRESLALLHRLGWPSDKCGCLQIYSASPIGIFPVGRRFCLDDAHALDLLGACALVFRRDAAEILVNWADTKGWRGDTASLIADPEQKKAADTFVGEVLTFNRLAIWSHNPSLANHLGTESYLGHRNNSKNRIPLNFPGVEAKLDEIFTEEIRQCE